MCKISIIIPCYNVEKYFERCINSLRNQSLSDVELILVDDESPDNVPLMCDELAGLDDRIKVIHKGNEGLGYARNSGLEIAKGDYVAFVDSDDFVDVFMYETLYKDAVKENADAVFCNFMHECENGIWKECREVRKRIIFSNEEVRSFMLDMVATAPNEKIERKYQMSVWHAIYRRSIIEEYNIKFMSERKVASEDIPFNVDYLSKCQKVVYRPECFYYYCLNGNSLTAKYLPEKFDRYKTLYKYLNERLAVYGNASKQRVCRFFIGMVRTQVLHLALVKKNNKISVLEKMVKDEIWQDVMNVFKYSWIPRPAAILLWLLLHRCFITLLYYAKLYNFMRK